MIHGVRVGEDGSRLVVVVKNATANRSEHPFRVHFEASPIVVQLAILALKHFGCLRVVRLHLPCAINATHQQGDSL